LRVAPEQTRTELGTLQQPTCLRSAVTYHCDVEEDISPSRLHILGVIPYAVRIRQLALTLED